MSWASRFLTLFLRWSQCTNPLLEVVLYSMRYQVIHTTTYSYDRPVTFAPHVVRLRPRCDVTQMAHAFSLDVTPQPRQMVPIIDLDGNAVLHLQFDDDPVTQLVFTATADVETFRTNPFDYLLEPWATHLPIDYPASLLSQLQPYLSGFSSNFPTVDPVAIDLSREIWLDTHGNPIEFLWELNQRIYTACEHMIRETGDPFPPSITWSKKAGSCRDLTILFMEACRSVGLATRFVSGYEEGDPDWEHRHLHAWAEVYLPGGGWRGYDPTQGLAVGDRYITLAAAPTSHQTSPVAGTLKTGIGAQAEMHYTLIINPQ